ncbi:MAG: hypothetical protein ACOCVF_00690 [bacterium]
MNTDKWKMFKNYIHNELGISKDDIREWVQEAVKEQAKIALNGKINNFDLDQAIKNMVYNEPFFSSKSLKNQVLYKLTNELMKKYELKEK